ncbi:MAG: DUF3089 domain-containing protein [Vicinamibacterales bacterium]
MAHEPRRRFAAVAVAACCIGLLQAPAGAAHAAASAQQPPAATPAPNDYTSGDAWLCRPGRKDACAIDLATTVVAADGTLTPEPWRPAANPPVDCFYVYPTISTDPAPNSDMTPDPAERNVVAQQFARFGSVCRLFAPLTAR